MKTKTKNIFLSINRLTILDILFNRFSVVRQLQCTRCNAIVIVMIEVVVVVVVQPLYSVITMEKNTLQKAINEIHFYIRH